MIDLRLGDCLEVLKDIPDKSIDLIVMDPPYQISATNGGVSVNKVKKLSESLKDLVDADITEGYDIEKFNTEFIRVMKDINIQKKKQLTLNQYQVVKKTQLNLLKKN